MREREANWFMSEQLCTADCNEGIQFMEMKRLHPFGNYKYCSRKDNEII